jgi:hypothetical protein
MGKQERSLKKEQVLFSTVLIEDETGYENSHLIFAHDQVNKSFMNDKGEIQSVLMETYYSINLDRTIETQTPLISTIDAAAINKLQKEETVAILDKIQMAFNICSAWIVNIQRQVDLIRQLSHCIGFVLQKTSIAPVNEYLYRHVINNWIDPPEDTSDDLVENLIEHIVTLLKEMDYINTGSPDELNTLKQAVLQKIQSILPCESNIPEEQLKDMYLSIHSRKA